MILVPFFTISTAYGSTKNLLSLPFQAPVFFALVNFKLAIFILKKSTPLQPVCIQRKDNVCLEQYFKKRAI